MNRTGNPPGRRENTLRVLGKIAADGYANPMAFLGEASPLMAAGTFFRSGLTQDRELLTRAYRENWLAKRIIDTPAEDMTRAWYALSTEMPEEDTEDLIRLEARHNVKQEIANAIRWARLYGGSIAVMIVRDGKKDLSQPMDIAGLAPGSFFGLLVLDRTMGVTPSMELVDNLDDPDYGEPMYYETDLDTGERRHIRIHHSRVLKFIGRELPRREAERENYWGASELEHIWDELQRRNSTSANIAELVFQANITTLKVADLGDMLATGPDERKQQVMAAMAAENRLRTSFGVQLIGEKDSMENLSYSFSGLSDIYEQFMMDMAGAAEIPATKLFGRSPQGMNATGESDMRHYQEMISAMQERMLRPALEKLVPVMAVSCWGFVPDGMGIILKPIRTLTAGEQMELAAKHMELVAKAYGAGLVSLEQAQEEMRVWSRSTEVWTRI